MEEDFEVEGRSLMKNTKGAKILPYGILDRTGRVSELSIIETIGSYGSGILPLPQTT